MSDAEIRGRFVWHELMTTSPEGAAGFYGRLVPWKAQASAMPDYSLWMSGKTTAGGLMGLPEGEEKAPYWLVYIGTADVDATVQKAQEMRGQVLKSPTDVPGVGRFAVLEDPQGARFAIFTPSPEAPVAPPTGVPGDFIWHELSTTDPEEATDFYVELFGWERGASHDLGGSMGGYQLIEQNGKQIGAIHKGRSSDSPRWLSYLQVVDADEAADIVRSAGGRVITGPREVPGGSLIAILQDPQGAAIAVQEPAQPIEPILPVRGRQIRKPVDTAPTEPTRKPAEAPASARKPARAPEPARAVAAEQPKPAATSEPMPAPEAEESEESEAPDAPAVKRASKPVRRKATKTPAKRVAARRAAGKKKAIAKPKRAKTAAKPARSAVKKRTTRTAGVAKGRTPARGRSAPGRKAAARKAVKGRRR